MASVARETDSTRAAHEALARVERTALVIRSTELLLEAFTPDEGDDGAAGVPAVTR